MKRTIQWRSIAILLGAVLMLATLLIQALPASASPVFSMSISPATQTVNVGDTFDVSVVATCTDAQTRGAQCGLSFTPGILECTSVSVGNFYGDWATAHGGSADPLMGFDIDNQGGTVSMVALAIFHILEPVGPSGSGVLYIYHFHALQNGAAQLTLLQPGMSDNVGNDIGPSDGLQVNNGQVTVGASSTPTPTPTETPTTTDSPTPTPTDTPSATPTATPALTATPGPTSTPSGTPVYPSCSGICLSVYPASQNRAVGEKFDVSVVVSTNIESRGAQCGLTFIPELVKCTGVDKGNFYADWAKLSNASTILLGSFEIDNVNGNVSNVGLAVMGGDITSGATGSGVLYTYHFEALKDGRADIHLTDAIVTIMSSEGVAGVVDIKPAPDGDLEVNDGSVFIGSAMPDLTISELNTKWLASGSTYQVSYTVQNAGNKAAGAFEVGLYIDDSTSPLSTESISGLSSGESHSGSLDVTLSGYSDKIKVVADPEGAIQESIKNNNSKETTFDQIKYTLILATTTHGNIQVQVDGTKLNILPGGRVDVYKGSQLRAEAVAEKGYQFSDWLGDIAGQPNPLTTIMNQDYTLNAQFQEQIQTGSGGISHIAIVGIVIAVSIIVVSILYYINRRRSQAS